jgi:cysteine desulfuration protein SufE
VWIQAELRDGRLRLFADSDAMITRGIIALLLRVLDGRPPAEVAHADLYFLEQTGLSTHLSPSRANGLAAMVKQIRAYASEWDAG